MAGKMRTSELRAIAQKGMGEIFFFSQFVYRPFTIFITRAYLALGWSANAATLHSCLVAVAGAGAVLFPSPSTYVGGAIALHIYFALDHVDGEIARVKAFRSGRLPGPAGEYLDYWVHFHSVNLFFAAVGVGLFRVTGNVFWAVAGVLADNVLGNFPRLTLARILWREAERRPGLAETPVFKEVVRSVTELDVGMGSRAKLSARESVFLVARELISFPGCLIALSLVLFFDAALAASGQPFRPQWTQIYLVLFVVISVVAKLRRTHVIVHQLRAMSDQG